MQFSQGVEYAFHTLFYMLDMPPGATIGIRELAELNRLSETYLSKIFTKLRKAGLVRSTPGAKGGYELAKTAREISFWDVVQAIEGPSYLFQCAELRQHNILAGGPEAHSCDRPCLIRVVMEEAEEQMRRYLAGKSLEWLRDQVYPDFPEPKKQAMREWLSRSIR